MRSLRSLRVRSLRSLRVRSLRSLRVRSPNSWASTFGHLRSDAGSRTSGGRRVRFRGRPSAHLPPTRRLPGSTRLTRRPARSDGAPFPSASGASAPTPRARSARSRAGAAQRCPHARPHRSGRRASAVSSGSSRRWPRGSCGGSPCAARRRPAARGSCPCQPRAPRSPPRRPRAPRAPCARARRCSS